MKSDIYQFREMIKTYHPAVVLELCVFMYESMLGLEEKYREQSKIMTEMSIQYSDMKDRYDKMQKELSDLKKAYEKEVSKYTLRARSTFGRKTEKMLDLIDQAANKTEDPDDENEAEETEDADHKVVSISEAKKVKGSGRKSSSDSKTDEKRKPPLRDSMKDLPEETVFDIHPEVLDEIYGGGNWSVPFWHAHETLEKVPYEFYKKVVYTPVVKVGEDGDLSTEPYEDQLINRSVTSPSLMMNTVYRRFVLGLPYERQGMDFAMHGIELSKQDLIHWTNKLIPKLFEPVCEHLTKVLIASGYTQNDETYMKVNKDGGSPGKKGVMWVHCTNETITDKPVVLFCYESSRSTEHLREFFQEFLGYITCDAYISYQILEAEKEGVIVGGCFMHCRRYLAEAFFLNDVNTLSEEQLRELPETKALFLIRDIYHEENKLKQLSCEARLKGRKELVTPRVDAFFSYIHSLRDSGIVYSEQLEKAITYAINQEKHLRVFLEDGNIPLDNGYVERIIRKFSTGRANWLFADTVWGAKVNALAYSIIETARANHVNIPHYLQFLFERMPKFLDGTLEQSIEDYMPWSDYFKAYSIQKSISDKEKWQGLFPTAMPPELPKRTKRAKSIESA